MINSRVLKTGVLMLKHALLTLSILSPALALATVEKTELNCSIALGSARVVEARTAVGDDESKLYLKLKKNGQTLIIDSANSSSDFVAGASQALATPVKLDGSQPLPGAFAVLTKGAGEETYTIQIEMEKETLLLSCGPRS